MLKLPVFHIRHWFGFDVMPSICAQKTQFYFTSVEYVNIAELCKLCLMVFFELMVRVTFGLETKQQPFLIC